jgi:NifB/MoaA-like Fe-S oxidoreductase
MVPWFLKDAAAVLKRAKPLPPVSATVVTGQSSLEVVSSFLSQLSAQTGCCLTAVAIPNRLFGASVTVTGLICCRDIISELRDKALGDLLLIPEVMLKEGAGSFLDNLTPEDLARELGLPVHSFEPSPDGLYKLLKKITRRMEKHR